ncbi:MAG: hypothetical protein WDW36_000654 [Sanguina aurantia]
MKQPLLILYGSQTGNAQDVAERLAREADIMLFQPRVLAMDSLDVTTLPAQQAVVFVAATAGQGEAPDNMRRFWKFLLKKSLAADSLAALHVAVFGLGDSGYPKYNVTAKKLMRRLEGLGANTILELGMGDDQHPSGYEATLDPWATKLWGALRAAFPLEAGVPVRKRELPTAAARPVSGRCSGSTTEPRLRRETRLAPECPEQPRMAEGLLLQLGTPKYCVTLSGPKPQPTRHLHTSASTRGAAGSAGAQPGGPHGGSGAGTGETRVAVAVAAAFRRLAAHVAGSGGLAESTGDQGAGSFGPWEPFLAPVRCNTRLTAPAHFQDVRHVELDLAGSGIRYDPGDLLAVFPRSPELAVDAFLTRMALDGDSWVQVSAFGSGLPSPDSPGSNGRSCSDGAGAGENSSHPRTSPTRPTHVGYAGPVVQAKLRDFVQGVLDVAGASPRRRLFEVLQHYATAEHERSRLQLFATAAGRDDLCRYNQKEGRTLLDILQDFPSACIPLHRLLEVCPLMRPRLFSLSSSQSLRPDAASITAALVRYTIPYKRTKVGLCSAHLAGMSGQRHRPAGRRPSEAEGAPRRQGVAAAMCAHRRQRQGGVQTGRAPTGPPPQRPGGAGSDGSAGAGREVHSRTASPVHDVHSADAAATGSGEGVAFEPGSHAAVWVERGVLRMPKDRSTPIILIGPGTGLAPFRSFLEERYSWLLQSRSTPQHALPQPIRTTAQTSTPDSNLRPAPAPTDTRPPAPSAPSNDSVTAPPLGGLPFAPAYLFFGCRNEASDFLYREQLQHYQDVGVLDREHGLTTAFSRDQSSKVYVTHRIRDSGAWLWRLLHGSGAHVYVSGSAQKMPAQVASAFERVAQAHGGLDAAAAAQYVRRLELGGRYHVEAWS